MKMQKLEKDKDNDSLFLLAGAGFVGGIMYLLSKSVSADIPRNAGFKVNFVVGTTDYNGVFSAGVLLNQLNVSTPYSNNITPGQSKQVSVDCVAPDVAGEYILTVYLLDSYNNKYSVKYNKTIKIV